MSESLATRLLQAYKQSFLFLVTAVIYSIPGLIVVMIGVAQLMSVFSDFLNSTDPMSATIDMNALSTALILFVVGYFLVIVGFFAGMLFSSTRGGTTAPLGFIEAYISTFKLILELATVLLFAIILSFIAQYLGSIGGLFIFISTVLIALFPLSSFFYVINFINSRK